ncbi:phosphopyruvate hydratase [Ehrlichia chaffeensis str. Heartland]|uniref:Enolase n=1 Tax=Ehrlichia chaffeensis (strain ATCC CRL-10679 / Arkansas) TaxID=205920 RepID=ENO_EHRCR|nr:phosphopyruvate hydratase [Ehrlichia chaffeensis]Q2GGS6.1 RecName: Full=Enolase; AltName: Full=2-phospho-D-glycerate hydro-lyase; AltName: Full=2-phosphoglycerate dehydratase [Ehrlichia chaffeensis str. Arkansas]ABD45381.1 enolase [Ehrlichia chaffeensis str. Arkansas]AHX03637.1 phosphopyruvate hydratase [Ehrlichia chaffeensis str. Heartland]AHX05642.1 phosphopyruvate hydratase [Ehrlichia chaffeensis str. Jax]AHX06633.1 phosphopyruvate hydratase [Ehrlichia chaffeensis str. Liberty]AHX07283.
MFNITISKILARQILDSRGYPTIEVETILSNDIKAKACVPSGASVGKFEAVELRDNDKNFYNGYGVTKAINLINSEVAPQIISMNTLNQEKIDNALIEIDGTDNKSRIGANSTLAISLAIAKAAALALNIPLYQYLGGITAKVLPTPLINVINGGMHADNNLDFQEFMIIPNGANKFEDAIRMSAEVFFQLKQILKHKKLNTNVGDEGGFAPNIRINTEVFEIIIDAVEKSGYKMYEDFSLGLDIAASTFYKDQKYKFADYELNTQELVEYYKKIISQYPIISIEDPIAEEDINGWKLITQELGNKIQIVGDDLFVTNCKLIQNGIDNNMANAVLIKPNQIGTLTETFNAIRLAQKNNYNVIISHRSGETEDTTISHIAVATNCGQIKTGSLSRSERLAKYNELLYIEKLLGISAIYYGSL